MTVKHNRWFRPLYLWVVGTVLVLVPLIHTWALGYSLRKRGSVEPEWCPEIPSGVPMEVGFGYKTQYLPPAVDCDVSSKEAGWEDAKHTILTADTVALAIGVALLVVGIAFYVRQRRNTRSVSA